MPQAVQIETQSEQQSLTLLRVQRTAWRTSREFAFDRTEQALDQGSAAVEPLRECSPHLGAHSMNTPGFLSALGGDHALRPELFPDVGVIPLAVELGVGQDQPNACLFGSRLDDCGQIRTIVPRTTSCDLRQQELMIQIHYDHPLQPMSPRQRFLPVMMHSAHKECADRSLRQARRIDRYAGSPPSFSARAAQLAHRLADRAIDSYFVQTLQEAIQSREVGHAHQPQRLAQFAVLAQPHFGFAKGPVLVTHQTTDRQQLRLRELALAESASVPREHRPADLQGDASKRQESDFGHRPSCLRSKQQFQPIWYLEFSLS